jgi:hypothetical protein
VSYYPTCFRDQELNLKIADQKRRTYTRVLRNFTEIAAAVMHDEDVSEKDADRGKDAGQRSATALRQ